MNPITPKNPKGAGRPKTDTVIYYRRIAPDLVKLLDEYLKQIKR